jgi:hypothetical protein
VIFNKITVGDQNALSLKQRRIEFEVPEAVTTKGDISWDETALPDYCL